MLVCVCVRYRWKYTYREDGIRDLAFGLMVICALRFSCAAFMSSYWHESQKLCLTLKDCDAEIGTIFPSRAERNTRRFPS